MTVKRKIPQKLEFIFKLNDSTEYCESAKFKTISFIRHRVLPKRNYKTNFNYLNLGCGRNIIENFDNADVCVIRQYKVPWIGVDG